MQDLTGRSLGDKYRLVRALGRGGMGAVYEATHTQLGRRVAIKVVHDRFAGDEVAAGRFLREARAASAIGHPNIAEVYDIGVEPDGTRYMVMELLEGRTVGDALRDEGRLAPGRALEIARQALSGLVAAHARGIVHRDIKPANLFLTRTHEGREQLKILDFGVSRNVVDDATLQGLTRPGTIVGTPAYMSPEQARGAKEIDARSDVWAMGVVLFELLTGTRPYRAGSYNELILKITQEPVPSLRSRAPDLPEAVVAAVERALVKDTDSRYADATQFLEDVTHALTRVDTPSALPAPNAPPAVDELEETLPPGETLAAARSGVGTERARRRAWPWKRIAWYGLTLPLAWGMAAVPADYIWIGATSIFGLPPTAPLWLAYVVFGALSAGLTVAAVATERFWRRGRGSRWLQGPGFLAFPVAALLVVWRCHEVLAGRTHTALASYRGYMGIGERPAAEITATLEQALSDHLNSSALGMILLFVLSLIVLLGYTFVRPDRTGPQAPPSPARPAWRPWIVVGASAAFLVLVELLVIGAPDPLLSPYRPLAYACWGLGAIPLVRTTPDGAAACSVAWRALWTAVIAMLAVTVLASIVGRVAMFQRYAPTPERYADAFALVDRAFYATWGVLAVLVGGLAAARARALGWVGLRALVPRPSVMAAALAAVVATGVPYLMVARAADASIDALAIPWTSPGLVEMVPATRTPGEPASYYIDRAPADLHPATDVLYQRLTGRSRREYAPNALLSALTAGAECHELLAAAITGPAEGAAPPAARCVTAVEARLYCEARGKRLPTPAEWDAALRGATDARRGPFAEWTMAFVSGTPTFTVKGLDRADETLATLRPDAWSREVGFRCAFTFEDGD